MRASGVFLHKLARLRCIGSVIRDVYYSATVSYCYSMYYLQTPLFSRAGHTPIARKNAKFTIKLSATGHAALGKGMVSRGEATHLP